MLKFEIAAARLWTLLRTKNQRRRLWRLRSRRSCQMWLSLERWPAALDVLKATVLTFFEMASERWREGEEESLGSEESWPYVQLFPLSAFWACLRKQSIATRWKIVTWLIYATLAALKISLIYAHGSSRYLEAWSSVIKQHHSLYLQILLVKFSPIPFPFSTSATPNHISSWLH